VTAYSIRTFGDPVLKQRASEVTELSGDLERIVRTMFETMDEAHGVGLAAPQVGIQKRFFTYEVDEARGVVINPEIVDTRGEWVYDEGCLSVPGLSFEIARPQIVTVRGIDLDGREIVIEGDELMGRMLLHEIDHLDGVLLLDRLDPEVRRQALRDLRERELAGTAPASGARRL